MARDKLPELEKNISRGVSAPHDWWKEVEVFADEVGINRSLLIRFAVSDYLKDGGLPKEIIRQRIALVG